MKSVKYNRVFIMQFDKNGDFEVNTLIYKK